MSTDRVVPSDAVFSVLPPWSDVGPAVGGYLISDNWNDYGYVTQYDLKLRSPSGDQIDIGPVKFGQFDMDKEQSRPHISTFFGALDERFFSVGQDVSYYEALRDKLDEKSRRFIFRVLRDMAFDKDLYWRARHEQVTITSLLRSVNPLTVEQQFHRIALGGESATPFKFGYDLPTWNTNTSPLSLPFSVEPESFPPTNIHALIGSNGVGKTRILRNLANAVADHARDPSVSGRLYSLLENQDPSNIFANLVSVSFSAFDSLVHVEPRSLPHTFVSLGSVSEFYGKSDSRSVLAHQFADSVSSLAGGRIRRWFNALDALGSDPIFADTNINDRLRPRTYFVDLPDLAGFFGTLSAGHKIVLLAMARLVETVSEKTLVLIDEPETHLHPPLLSAFVRALSELLIDQNGVAIVATHSPVVLQETPRSCVWKLRRSGDSVAAERPRVETFGENVGVLTREVFGLEVTRSGFHKMLEDAVRHRHTFEEIRDLFGGQLGGEALGILRVLIAEWDGRNRGKS